MRNCILCDGLKYGDQFIEKRPERVRFCLKCANKHRDDTKYEGEHFWISGDQGKGYFVKDGNDIRYMSEDEVAKINKLSTVKIMNNRYKDKFDKESNTNKE